MKTLLFLTFSLIATQSYGQSLEQYVIGTAGDFGLNSGGTTLSWTLGEPIVSTENSSTAILTQGFQQPIVVNSLSTNQALTPSISLQVFPNPTFQELSIQKDISSNLKAELFDILGQRIAQYDLVDNTTRIDLNNLPAAHYLLRVSKLDKTSIQTFKIQKIQ
ncbi:T9SS type A sorting domain-containing protein [Aureispira anguillae]|nr:T9SS type A sorting domain-containing protein [Aureispira anguillae]